MQRATERMQCLISDLLAYSRVTTRGKPFEMVNLDETARDVVSDLEINIREAEARIEVGELPVLEADPVQMRQLLQNLIANAVKFRQDGVQPVVTVVAEPLSRDNDASSPDTEWCRLVVTDNGIGFDQKYADRIFGVFQRLHRRHEYSGSGIGLAVCRRIVERHGGRIGVKSTPGQGATFFIDLPLRQPEPEGEEEA
jgi:light-regulated signal transduction histidine kinase (bacteriophytochrome)